MNNQESKSKPADSEQRSGKGLSSSALLGVLAAMTGMEGSIGDTEDMEAKEAAFDEMIEGKWTAIYAQDLKAGHRMRDAAGGEVEITGVMAAADDHIYATTKDRPGIHIPRTGLVLISPNDQSVAQSHDQKS